MPPVVRGPESPSTGDPEWIEPVLAEGGAINRDRLYAFGRWKARYYPTDKHLADDNPLTMGRVGLRAAMARLGETVSAARQAMADGPVEEPGVDEPVNEDPTVKIIVAVYDALEWIHSLDEHMKREGKYENATDLDAVLGAYVEGAIGARNASHHGLRRVVGAVRVPPASYVAVRERWVLDEVDGLEASVVQVRWVEKLPLRIEAKEAGKSGALRRPEQEAAYEEHLAGREVLNTLMRCWAFFLHTVVDQPVPPSMLEAWGPMAANIDPTMFDQAPYEVRYLEVGGAVHVHVPGVGGVVVAHRDDIEGAARALIASRFGSDPAAVVVDVAEGVPLA